MEAQNRKEYLEHRKKEHQDKYTLKLKRMEMREEERRFQHKQQEKEQDRKNEMHLAMMQMMKHIFDQNNNDNKQ